MTCVSPAAAPDEGSQVQPRFPSQISARLLLLSQCSGAPPGVETGPLATFGPPRLRLPPTQRCQCSTLWLKCTGEPTWPDRALVLVYRLAERKLWQHSATRGQLRTRIFTSPPTLGSVRQELLEHGQGLVQNVIAAVRHSDRRWRQYLFVMLHLQSLQLASLCAFPLAFVLCLMKLRSQDNTCSFLEPNNMNLPSLLIFSDRGHVLPDWSN